MKKNKKNSKPMTREEREVKQSKARALERESNITLASIAVVIVSFFLLLYIHSAFKVNYLTAKEIIDVVTVLFLIGAVACAVVAVWKKKHFLWEYVVFTLILAMAYYLLPRGASGIPGLIKETGNTFEVSAFAMKVSNVLSNKNIIYALWGINVLYCIFAIVFHSAKYRKIKKGSI